MIYYHLRLSRHLLSNFKTRSKFYKINLLFWSEFHSSCYREMFIFIPFEEPFLWDTGVLNIPVTEVSSLPTKNNHTNPHPGLLSLFFIVASLPPSPKSTSKDWKTLGDEFPLRPQELPFSSCSRWLAGWFLLEMLPQSPRTRLHSASFVITTNIPAAIYARHHHRAI